MHGNRSYSLSLIDNYPHPMWWDRGRGKEFAIALRPFEPELAWDHIHYRDLIHKDMTSSAEAQKVLSSDGLILSGSSYNLSEKDVRERFEHIAELVRRYEKPILGICFGHQLLASAFGFSIRPMRPEYIDSEWWEHTQEPALLTVEKGFPLIDSGSIWVEFSHHEEIQQSKKFNRVFKVLASTEACRIQIMMHREKPFFGVQFHPETGKDPRARWDGQKIFEGFIRYIKAMR